MEEEVLSEPKISIRVNDMAFKKKTLHGCETVRLDQVYKIHIHTWDNIGLH